MNDSLPLDLWLALWSGEFSRLSQCWWLRPWRSRLEKEAQAFGKRAIEAKSMQRTLDDEVENERVAVQAAVANGNCVVWDFTRGRSGV